MYAKTRLKIACSLPLLFFLLAIVCKGQNQNLVEQWLDSSNDLYRTQTDSALQLAQKAYRVSQANKWTATLARSLDQIGLAQERNRQLDSARWYFARAFIEYKNLQDTLGMAQVKLHQGGLERREDFYDKALEHYFAGLKYLEKQAPNRELGLLHNGIGLSYRRLENFEQAEVHLLAALRIRQEIKDQKGLASSHSSLANLFGQQGNIVAALNENQKALALYKVLADTISLMRVLNNMGNLYLAQEQYDSAKTLYLHAITILEKTRNQERLVSAYNNLATLYSRLDDHSEAVATYNRALMTLGDRKAWDLRRLLLINLATSYERLGQYELANDYLKRHLPYRDSTYNAKALTRAKELEKEYELARKQQLLAEQEKIIVLQQNQKLRLGFLVFFLLLLLGGSIIFFQARNRRRRRNHQQEVARMLREQGNLLLDAMLKGQENAQQHFAKELHDNIGMMLSTVNLHFSRLEENLNRQDEALEKAKSILLKTVKEVRKLSHNLLTGTLQHLGLVPALEELKQEVEKTGFLQMDLNFHGMETLQMPNSTAHSLYRIIQELLTNTVRHAQANKVNLQLTRRDEMLNLVFQDDGVGFIPNEGLGQSGIGLQNVKARIHALQGDLHLNSQIDQGTTVIVDIPLTHVDREWLPQKN